MTTTTAPRVSDRALSLSHLLDLPPALIEAGWPRMSRPEFVTLRKMASAHVEVLAHQRAAEHEMERVVRAESANPAAETIDSLYVRREQSVGEPVVMHFRDVGVVRYPYPTELGAFRWANRGGPNSWTVVDATDTMPAPGSVVPVHSKKHDTWALCLSPTERDRRWTAKPLTLDEALERVPTWTHLASALEETRANEAA